LILPSSFRRADWPKLAWLAVAYALLAKAVLAFFALDGVTSIVWPPSGLALAALLLGGAKYWPAVLLGAFAGNLMAGSSVLLSLSIASGNTLEALAGLYLLTRTGAFDRRLTRLGDYLRLCRVALLSALVSASVGNASLWLAGLLPAEAIAHNFLMWWQGDVFGFILVTPLILVWRQLPDGWIRQRRSLETLTCFALALLVGQIIFMGWFHEALGGFGRPYVMFVFVAWAAVSFGLHGASLLLGIVALQALVGSFLGEGDFAAQFARSDLSGFWLYMLVLSVVGMALAVVTAERMKVEQSLSTANDNLAGREALLQQIQDTASVGIFLVNMEGRITHANQFMAEMFRWPLDALIGEEYITLVHPAEREAGRQKMAALLKSQITVVDLERQYWRADQTMFWGHLKGKQFYDVSGEQLGLVGVIADISERKQAEEEMELASVVYQSSGEAMMVTDADGTIVAVNPAFTLVTGYQPDEVIGRTPQVLRSGRHDKAFYQSMWRALATTGTWRGEIWDRRKSGEIYPKLLTITTTFNEAGLPLRRVALFYDITEKKKSEEVIWHQANFDSLTGLPNRQMFMDRLDQEIKKSHRAALPLALMFLDLDRFKEINDTLGHDMGDILLKETARRLSSCVRESDTVARLGGDEFTIILGEIVEIACVERIAADILQKLAKPFALGDELVYMTTSIGITLYPDDADRVDALIKHADQAMYAAKAMGRNRYSYFTPSMQESAQNRMRLANDLRSALAGNEFRVFYQPIVDMATGAIHKAEALIRWQHPVRGLVSPAEFIPIAEDTGMIVDIGDWVFYEAVRQVEAWRSAYCDDFQISVNKSPVQFRRDGSTHGLWVEYMQERGLPGQSITVEITEGLLMEAGATVSKRLLAFRDAGIQVSLDDFGTGYSSLSYLKKFDIDYLKIDQAFVRNLAPESHDMALCEAIIVMAHKLGIKVIAEGVETELQRDLLTSAGCDFGQGYHYSRPVPAEAFEVLLSAQGKGKARLVRHPAITSP
jgi:diguanylate cyclase (GGDEF)-like protein/PAS domain S-box-containing protein